MPERTPLRRLLSEQQPNALAVPDRREANFGDRHLLVS
jgi:hypothetical protein